MSSSEVICHLVMNRVLIIAYFDHGGFKIAKCNNKTTYHRTFRGQVERTIRIRVEEASGIARGDWWLTTAEFCFRFFEVDLYRPAIEISAIQSCNGSARFMPFHFNEAKSFALSGKNIRNQL